MQILVVNPERFSNLEITSLGEIPQANVYLAVSLRDARRLLESVRMDVVVCNIIAWEEMLPYQSIRESASVLLIGILPDMILPEEGFVKDSSIVTSGEEMMNRLRIISTNISNQIKLEKGIHHITKYKRKGEES